MNLVWSVLRIVEYLRQPSVQENYDIDILPSVSEAAGVHFPRQPPTPSRVLSTNGLANTLGSGSPFNFKFIQQFEATASHWRRTHILACCA
jgi:hypothetical protein